ncbi:MAG: cell division protein FtsZ [Bacteroidales bacterium]|nr:cell division protein FtsZ [Bacteroidales bacterium]MBP5389847.1 cell division protein FtsZ [Bacteroidales bacterium]MBP5635396.1 cell division protein FtsZ [Bacteroidales bacterium]
MEYNKEVLPPDWTPENSMIKVIGVGGGGCNAVTYMYNERIEGCSFIVCNTDAAALQSSNVPIKIQMGKGLGAGTDPSEGRKAALESQDEIAETVLDNGTEMLFVTAGMGGGTGTGAAPVIAKMAKDRGILTVGVVTVPFDNEGNESVSKAIDGIHELEKNVDSLLIIKNQNILKYYGDLLLQDAFPKSNEVLATAVKGIIEIIGKPGYINVDFKDVKTMMRNSGCALMGSGSGTGDHRIEDAVREAFSSPLLNDYDLKSAKNILLNVTVGRNEQGISAKQYEMINEEIKKYTGNANRFKQGLIYNDDPEFGDRVNITAIVVGLQFTDIMGPNEDLGNYIYITDDFVYNKAAVESEEGISLPESASQRVKIGFSTKENTRTFHFEGRPKPVLCIGPGEEKSRLENEAAIRRAVRTAEKD